MSAPSILQIYRYEWPKTTSVVTSGHLGGACDPVNTISYGLFQVGETRAFEEPSECLRQLNK
jgi:hypothetical protein